MSAGVLILSFSSISVTLRVFSAANIPRERISLGVDTSRNGATLLTGPPTIAQKHLWDISAIVSNADRLLLQDIHDLWQDSPGNIVLRDGIRELTETSPRTRPLVSGTSATTVASRVRYFAEFNVGFVSDLSIDRVSPGTNSRWQVAFQLRELAKRLAS